MPILTNFLVLVDLVDKLLSLSSSNLLLAVDKDLLATAALAGTFLV
jgi:hypothetical protein